MGGHLLPPSKVQSYWAGDDIVLNAIGSEEYREISKRSMRKLQDFVGSPNFAASVMKGAISSIPRWRFAREMGKKVHIDESDGDSDDEFTYVSRPVGLPGVARGQKGFLQACREIFHGKNELFVHLIDTETEKMNPDLNRLGITRRSCAAAVYLAEKNPLTLPEHVYLLRDLLTNNIKRFSTRHFFSSAIVGTRRVLRGELQPIDYVETLASSRHCCCDAEVDGGIISFLDSSASPSENVFWGASLVEAFTAARDNHMKKGGFRNGRLGGLFSICRMLGLRRDCM